MTIEQLRHKHRTQPFQPFRIHLVDGRSLDVMHPEALAYGVSGRTISVAKPTDVFEIVDLLLVVSLEPIKNGKRRRA
jgi:hypothetical protein